GAAAQGRHGMEDACGGQGWRSGGRRSRAVGQLRVSMTRAFGAALLVFALLSSACRSREPGRERGPAVVVVGADAGLATGPLTAEHEPNDVIAQAQALPIGTGAQGRIDRPRDVDLYRIAVSGGTARTLRAQVSGIAGLDLSLDLLDQAGNRVLGVNDGKPGEPEIISAVTL